MAGPLTPVEFLEFVDQAKSVIVYGDTKGRQFARHLLNFHFESKIVIDTRFYQRHEYQPQTKKTTFFDTSKNGVTHVGNIVTNRTRAKSIMLLSKEIRKLRRPVIVDSFSDIYKVLMHAYFEQEKRTARTITVDFHLVEFYVNKLLDDLSNYKKKYILFCDEHENAENQYVKMKTWWKTAVIVDGIVKFKDNQIILEKDRIGYKLNQLQEMAKYIEKETEGMTHQEAKEHMNFRVGIFPFPSKSCRMFDPKKATEFTKLGRKILEHERIKMPKDFVYMDTDSVE